LSLDPPAFHPPLETPSSRFLAASGTRRRSRRRRRVRLPGGRPQTRLNNDFGGRPVIGQTLGRAFTPATALMGRLKYAQKFVLLGLVLCAPLAYVVKSYLDQQSSQIGFSAKERVGVVYVKPASELLDRVVAARAA